jgi:hypothetical protein
VSYTGTGSADSVGHGLDGQKPDMVIIKRRNATTDWVVYTDVIDGSWDYLYLNKTDAKGDTTVFSADTDTFDFTGSSTAANVSGAAAIAYCFANAEGLCKVGSYVGNGSADGTFVYTGFRPAYIMIKRTDAAAAWHLADNKRSPYNPQQNALVANDSTVESTAATWLDMTSNGFKLRYTGAHNASGGSFIYLAIAEQPFAFANAR